MKSVKGLRFFMLLAPAVFLMGCQKEEPPTKSSMEGVWTVTQAFNDADEDITNDINFPITAFYLTSDNSVASTAGPMWMHIVYGDNKYTDIAGQIDQVFNYASLDFTGGEFFVGGGVQERFTIEMKLEGLPGQKALTELLDVLGIGNDYLDVVVYHKFKNVKVSFEDDHQTMIWEFDSSTIGEYNTKDQFGDYVFWEGFPVDKFMRGRYILTKQSKDLKEVVQDAS